MALQIYVITSGRQWWLIDRSTFVSIVSAGPFFSALKWGISSTPCDPSYPKSREQDRVSLLSHLILLRVERLYLGFYPDLNEPQRIPKTCSGSLSVVQNHIGIVLAAEGPSIKKTRTVKNNSDEFPIFSFRFDLHCRKYSNIF